MEITSIRIILPWITFLILPSVRAFLMIKTDCAVHTILHPSFKRAKRQMVCAGRSIETFVCVWMGVRWGGEVFRRGPVFLGRTFNTIWRWMKKESGDPEKRLEEKEGERQRERDVRVKPIPVDPFGMPSFFLWLSSESSLTSSINTVQPPFTHTHAHTWTHCTED